MDCLYRPLNPLFYSDSPTAISNHDGFRKTEKKHLIKRDENWLKMLLKGTFRDWKSFELGLTENAVSWISIRIIPNIDVGSVRLSPNCPARFWKKIISTLGDSEPRNTRITHLKVLKRVSTTIYHHYHLLRPTYTTCNILSASSSIRENTCELGRRKHNNFLYLILILTLVLASPWFAHTFSYVLALVLMLAFGTCEPASKFGQIKLDVGVLIIFLKVSSKFVSGYVSLDESTTDVTLPPKG